MITQGVRQFGYQEFLVLQMIIIDKYFIEEIWIKY